MRTTFHSGIAVLSCLLVAAVATAQVRTGPAPPRERLHLSGQVELARLVDLAAERLGIDVEYDDATLRGSVTLRLRDGLSNDELWALTNGLLASRGFTVVQRPGDPVLAVVRIADASGAARLELPAAEALSGGAGFGTVVARIQHREMTPTLEAIRLVLSKPGGTATVIADTRLILLSDTRPRLDQAMAILELVDLPVDEPTLEILPAVHVPAGRLAGMIGEAVTAREAITRVPMRGRVTATHDDAALIVVAPEDELPSWQRLAQRFDQQPAVETRTYLPLHFDPVEVARLVEEAGRDQPPRGAGERWRVVVNTFTGALIVTATVIEHERIGELIDRLDEMPALMRQQTRRFIVRNRNVREVADILGQLVDAGVFRAGAFEPRLDVVPSGGSPQFMPPPAGLPSMVDEVARQREELLGPRRAGSVTGAPRAASAGVSGTDDELSIRITADEGTNSIIAIGEPRVLDHLGLLVESLDIRQPQVMLEVLVVTLTDAQTIELGVELEKMEVRGDTLMRIGTAFGLTPVAAMMGDMPISGDRGLGVSILRPGDFRVVLRALETINDGRSLNVPRVLVNNNQQAVLDSVLKRPFSVIGAGLTVSTTSFGGTFDAGTSVTVRPQIAEGDHLVLEYSVSLSTFVGEPSDPSLPPPLQSTNLSSVVTIPDGHVATVGGLEALSETKAVQQLPFLGNLPVLGELFKRRTRSTSRSRFFVFIRADTLRRSDFDDLRYFSERDAVGAELEGDWPTSDPRLMR